MSIDSVTSKGSTGKKDKAAILASKPVAAWARVCSEKSPYEARAEKCAALTIPYSFPKNGSNRTLSYKAPVASIGPSAVKHLAARMLDSMYPMGSNYLRLPITSEAEAFFADNPDGRIKAETAFERIATQISSMMTEQGRRSIIFEAIIWLIVSGNALLKFNPVNADIRLYSLRDYGVIRDTFGKPMVIVTRDYALVEELGTELLIKAGIEASKLTDTDYSTSIEVFTVIEKQGKRYVERTFINETQVGEDVYHPEDACPYIPLRLRTEQGSSYGRSYVEDYIGALGETNALTYALSKAIQADSRTLYLVRPGSPTSFNTHSLAMADSGSFIPGEAADISTLQANKQASNQVTMQAIAMHESTIRDGFLMADSVRRNAERVTAEEIRYMAAAREQQIGTIYHLLTQELVKPLALLDQRYLERKKAIVNLDALAKQIGVDKVAIPTPITGEATLLRAKQAESMQQLLNMASTVGATNVINMTRFIEAYANTLELSTSGLLKTEEELAAEQQAALQAQLAQAAAPNVVNGEYAMAQQQQAADMQQQQTQ